MQSSFRFDSAIPALASLALLVSLGSPAMAAPQATTAAERDIQEPYDSETGFTEPPMEPAAAAAGFQLPEGFHLSVFSAEPEIRQPIAMASDERGRLWVAENYTYAERELNFDETLRDRIVILADTDGDGSADERKVFWDQANKLTSIEIGHDGVWALCAPQLLFLPDRDHDDVMDGEPIVILDGWDEDAVRHNVVNGLKWGPDGWLYGRHGILASSFVGRPGTPQELRTAINCGIWRYHPRRDTFEIVATGTTNPWGMDWNAEGELLFINTVIGHLWHAVPGAHFERMYGGDFNPHWYSLVPQVADHVHWNTAEAWSDIRQEFTAETDRAGGGHAHIGLLIYQESQWPESYRNDIYTLNLHGRRINRDRLERQGSSYTAKHEPDFAQAADLWFRGIDLITGPHGQVWIADWSDTGECHENDGVHRSSGRIYELRYGQSPANSTRLDLASESSERLADLAIEGDEWWSRQARRLLVDRLSDLPEELPIHNEIRRLLEDRLQHDSLAQHRLRALWLLYGLEAIPRQQLINLLDNEDAVLRRWAVRLLSDQSIDDPQVLEALVRLARQESDGLVLTYLASSLQRLAVADRWQLAEGLACSSLAQQDGRLQRMIWYGIEPSVAADAEQVGAWLTLPLPPDLIRWTARRLAVRFTEVPQVLTGALEATRGKLDAAQADAFLDGMATGLKGASQIAAPEGWLPWSESLPSGVQPASRLAVAELETVFGAGRGEDALLVIAKDANEELAIRRQALLSLGRIRSAAGRGLLIDWINDRDLGEACLQALRSDDNPEIAPAIVARFDTIRLGDRPAAITTLCARAASARLLLAAVEAGTIDPQWVTPYEWRQLLSLGDEPILQQVERLWPQSREWQDLRAERERVVGILEPQRLANADVVRGAELFTKNCATCHKLLGQGAEIGPDLTGGQRSNLNYLIDNIVAPSAEVATNYRTSLFELSDGQVVVGVVLSQLPDRVVVQTKEGPLTLPREDIEERRESGNSLMPNGLLNALGDQQVVDLFGYLQRAGTN